MRSVFRPLSALLLAVGIVTCVDSPSGLAGSHGRATLAFVPRFSTSASQAAPLYNANGLVYDSVRIIVTLPPTDAVTLKDTTVAFSTTDSTLSVDMSLNTNPGQQVDLELQYKSGAQVLYDGKGSVTAVPIGASGGANPSTITVNAVGPGANTASLTITPPAGSYPAIPVDTIKFTAAAVDSNKAAIASPILVWSTSDTTIATIGVTSGFMVPTGKRGTVTVTVATLNKASSSVALSLIPPATQIVVSSGGAQSAPYGQALAQPVVVEVEAADNGPVPGKTVVFSSTTATVSPTTAVTNANGQAQTTVTLGTTLGSYTITATSGTFTTSTTATATAGAAASIALNAGNNQTATAGTAVPVVPSVIVKDANGNPVSGASVTFAVATGGGSVAGGAATTNASGIAAPTSWTLGPTAGANTLAATSGTVAGSPVTFTATATVGVAASIAVNAGAGQSAIAGSAVAIPPSVIVKDAGGNPVGGVNVTFAVATGGGSAVGGAATTNASGIAAVTSWTLGATPGTNTLTATSGTLAGSPVTFTATGTQMMLTQVGPSSISFTAGALGAVASDGVQVIGAGGHGVAGVAITVAFQGSGGVFAFDTTVTTDATGSVTYGEIAASRGSAPSSTGTGTVTWTNATLAGSPVVTNFTVVAAAVSQLQMTATSFGGAVNATLPSVLVSAEDQYGNVATTTTGSVAMALGANSPSGASLGGTTTQTLVNGVATFPNLTVNMAGTTYTLVASFSTFHATSPVFSATAAGATKLAFLQNPTNTASGSTISPAVTVQIQDQSGNLVTTATNSVMITGACGTGSFGLSGTNPVAAVAGVATFSSLLVTGPATNCLLTAAATGLGSAPSTPFAITAAAPPSIALLNGPANDTLKFAAGSPPTLPTIEVLDASENPVASFPVHLHVIDIIIVSTITDTVVLKDTTITTPANGTLSFFLPTPLDTIAGNFGIVVTSGGPTVSAVPVPQIVIVSPLAASRYVVTSPVTTTPAAGATIPIQAQLTDRYGNFISTSGKTVTWTVTPASGDGTLSGSPSTTNTSGSTSITYTAPALGGAAALIKATDGVDTGSVTLTPTAPAALSFTAGGGQLPSSTVQSGVPFPTQPRLQLVDANGNPIADAGLSIQTALISGSVGLAGQIPSTGANGVAVFSGLAASGATGTFQLQFVVAGAPSIVSPVITETLTAGQPSAITNFSTLYYVQTGSSNTMPSSSVTARVTDASGNPVSGETITWSFQAPCPGATFLSLATSTTTTNSNGVAGSPVVNINSANTGASCRLQAFDAAIGSQFFGLVLVPSAQSLTWVGTTNTLWETGTNWAGGSAPIANSQVFIPAAVPGSQPTLTHFTGHAIASLTTEVGSALNLNQDTLQLSGDALLSGAVTNGLLHFAGSGTDRVMGVLPSAIIDQTVTDSLVGDVSFQAGSTVDLHGTIAMPGTDSVNFGAVSLLRVFSTAFARIPSPFTQLEGLSPTNCHYSSQLANTNQALVSEIGSICTSDSSISFAPSATLVPGRLGAVGSGLLKSRNIGLER